MKLYNKPESIYLNNRIVKRLDNIKGPTHKGDYSKMEAESVSHQYASMHTYQITKQDMGIHLYVSM